MAGIERKTKILEGVQPNAIPYDELMAACEPVILKGLVHDWPLVQAGLSSDKAAMQYIETFYNGKTIGTFLGEPRIKGRYAYNSDLTGLNFDRERLPLDEFLARIASHAEEQNPPGLYSGSMTIDACLPGLRQHNDIVFDHAMFADNAPLASIWMGNRSLISAHYDAPNNIACCAVGRRRFTLFPPEQIHNLYPGPLEPTPGGQAISLVDFSNPDLARYPRAQQALEAGQVADLEPGDALFYPSLWWHQVESLSPFNVLINYWWNQSPQYLGTPMNALYHALLSLRDRPQHEKDAWRAIFDYYIFNDSERPREHIPEHAQGALAPVDATTARQLRALLINKLNR